MVHRHWPFCGLIRSSVLWFEVCVIRHGSPAMMKGAAAKGDLFAPSNTENLYASFIRSLDLICVWTTKNSISREPVNMYAWHVHTCKKYIYIKDVYIYIYLRICTYDPLFYGYVLTVLCCMHWENYVYVPFCTALVFSQSWHIAAGGGVWGAKRTWTWSLVVLLGVGGWWEVSRGYLLVVYFFEILCLCLLL